MHIADYVWMPRHSWNLKGLILKWVAALPFAKPAQHLRSQPHRPVDGAVDGAADVAVDAPRADSLLATDFNDATDETHKNWGDHDLLIDVTRARFEEPENRPGKLSMWL